MKRNLTPSQFSRRSALGLVLAGAALSATTTTRALATGDVLIRAKPYFDYSPIVFTTCSGQAFTARFDSDLLIGASGFARGAVRFEFDDDRRVNYVPEVGGLDFDRSGQPIRARVLLRLRRSAGAVAQDYAMLTVEPDPGEDCLIYTTTGTQVEFVRFEVPGAWTLRR